MELTMLGTGNAMVTECYNTCFAIRDNNQAFLVDAGGGNGILRQLKRAGLDWRDIREIFVTHKHTDHLLGVIWLLRVYLQEFARNQLSGSVSIYAHDEVVSILRGVAEALFSERELRTLDDKLRLVEVQDGETRPVIGHEVTFFDIRSSKAKQFGFCMDLGSGERLTCCGDEPYQEHERPYVENSKWLLHEAFCLSSQANVFHPYRAKHSTVKDACETAERLHVQNLLLYHTEDKNLADRKRLYGEEGRAYFSGNLFVPDDLETLTL